MAESERSGYKRLAFGCLGCLGLLILGVMTALVFQRLRSGPLENDVLTKELSVPAAGTQALSESAPGLITLDLSDAEIHVDPGKPGEPARVEASYDAGTYELEDRFEVDADEAWTYRVVFRRKGGSPLFGLGERLPTIRVFLPVDIPFELDLDIDGEGAQVELGGLWLTSADLDFSSGGCELTISNPLSVPAEKLSIIARVGVGAFRSIGNASPRNLDVDFSMGGTELDLRGRWVRDAEISLEHEAKRSVFQRIHGVVHKEKGVVRLPAGTNISGLGEAGYDRSGEEGPTLAFRVGLDLDDLKFID